VLKLLRGISCCCVLLQRIWRAWPPLCKHHRSCMSLVHDRRRVDVLNETIMKIFVGTKTDEYCNVRHRYSSRFCDVGVQLGKVQIIQTYLWSLSIYNKAIRFLWRAAWDERQIDNDHYGTQQEEKIGIGNNLKKKKVLWVSKVMRLGGIARSSVP
jgi:hypothetical protein